MLYNGVVDVFRFVIADVVVIVIVVVWIPNLRNDHWAGFIQTCTKPLSKPSREPYHKTRAQSIIYHITTAILEKTTVAVIIDGQRERAQTVKG